MKKVLSALLAVAMVMSLLVGCGSTEPAAEETKPATSTEETKAPAEEKKEEAPAEEKEEAAPEWSEEEYLPFANGEKVVLGISQSSKVADYDSHPMTKYLEELTGVDIEFMFFSGSSAEKRQAISLMVAGGEKLPDVIMSNLGMKTQGINELGRDGYLVDLKEYIGDMSVTPYMTMALDAVKNADMTLYNRIMNKVTDPETGGIYQAPWASQLVVWDDIGTISWINTKWLEAVGMQKPTTIAELYDVLVAFRDQDPNGNGKKDEIPMAGNNASGGAHMLSYVINAFVYFDFDNHFNATDGTVWAPWASDEYREAIKLLAQWYKEGLIAQHCFTGIESKDFKPIVTPDDEVAVVGIFAGHSSVYMNADNKVFYEYEGLEPIYVGETEEGGYLVSRAGVVYEGSQISVDAENLETAIRFVDFIYRDETTASFRHGIKGTNWDWLDPNETDDNVDNIKVLDDGQAFFQGVWTWGGNTSTIFTNNNYLNGGEAGSEWLKYEQKWYREITSWMLDPKQPEEIARDFMFTAEEQEIYNSHQQVFKDYINEGLAKFGTGVWDPNSDADWNNYLAELDALGLETYLGTVQSGYTKYLEVYGK